MRDGQAIVGHLDAGTSAIVSGWVWDPNDPARTISVDIVEGERWLATVPATHFGDDLLQAGIGDGHHRFWFAVPPLPSRGVRSIGVRVAGTLLHLMGSPVTLSPTPGECGGSSSLSGHIDPDSSEVVSGWAWDPARPDEPVFVDIVECGHLLATVPAEVFGRDLLDAGIGNGCHRFEFVTPRRLHARRDQEIHVYFAGTKVPLTGSPLRVTQVSLEKFVHEFPTPQTAIDTFTGEWVSAFPHETDVKAGAVNLFHDPRITWALDVIGTVNGLRVLELGPLEGGHTYLLTNRGARVVAVEGNRRNFLKCLVTKEVLGLQHASFLCGDLLTFLRDTSDQFDVCLASGVLYHMEHPAELVALMARRARMLILWTHYYDAELCARGMFKENFVGERRATLEGFTYTQYRQEYGDVLFKGDYCGGTRPVSSWMSRADLMRCLMHFGFTDIRATAFEDRESLRGPSLCLVAAKGQGPVAATGAR